MEEAIEFLRREFKSVTNTLTVSHHKLLESIIGQSERSQSIIKERHFLQNKWRIAEQLYATKTPVMEAEYAFDESTALSLYDCLIPMLKENRRL